MKKLEIQQEIPEGVKADPERAKWWDSYFDLRFADSKLEMRLECVSFDPNPTFSEFCEDFEEDPRDPMANARFGAFSKNMREGKNIRLYEEAYRLGKAHKAIRARCKYWEEINRREKAKGANQWNPEGIS